jgi:DNA sulfur modification protein DndD
LKVVESDSVSKKDQDTRKILSILITAIDDSFESFKGEMRAQVQEKATEYLQVLTSEPEIYGSVAISPNYQIGMLTPEGKQLQATNAGHRQMLTTAFVSAMAAVSSEKTPFVMDTALSHLDPANSKKMLEWTKYVDQQVVLLVQPKELPADVAQRELGSAIGRKYEVTKTSAEVSEIKETV